MTYDFGAWRGCWVWSGPVLPLGDPIAPNRGETEPQMALFRREFRLEHLPRKMPARISADSRYRLQVNGQVVGYGPVRAQPRRLRADDYDLAPYLRTGDNIITVEVLYYGRVNSFWMPAVGNATLGRGGALLFEARYDTDQGEDWIASDDKWAVLGPVGIRNDARDPNASHVGGGVPALSVDATQIPIGWDQLEFDAAGWDRAHIIVPIHIGGPGRATPPVDPYGAVPGHDLALPTTTIVDPVAIVVEAIDGPIKTDLAPPAARVEDSVLNGQVTAKSVGAFPLVLDPLDGHWRVTLDLGRMAAIRVSVDLVAAAGATIDISVVEEPITHPAHFGAHGGLRYVARGAQDRLTAFDRLGGRYVVLISDAPMQLTAITVSETLYPWQGESTLTSSDSWLTRLYQVSRRTVAINSWDCFIDCPSREQRSWVGDSVVAIMVHLIANTDRALCWHQAELAASPRSDGILPLSVAGDGEEGQGFTIPDWSLHWLHGVYQLYQYDIQPERLRPLLAVAEGVLRWFLPFQSSDGLLRGVPEWPLIDWSAVYSGGCSAPINALWARGLREFAQMSRTLGDAGRAIWAEERYREVAKGFEVFWDQSRGIYTDQPGLPAANQISTAAAIVAGLVPQDRLLRAANAMITNTVIRSWLFGPVDPSDPGARFRSVLTSSFVADWDILREVVRAQPFMSYIVHEALALAGLGDRILGLLADWENLITPGYDTLREVWQGNSFAHAWSACPAYDLVAYVAGITPASPGYTRARIAPIATLPSQFAVTTPTPFGMIAFERNERSLKVHSPVDFDLIMPGKPAVSYCAGRHDLVWI